MAIAAGAARLIAHSGEVVTGTGETVSALSNASGLFDVYLQNITGLIEPGVPYAVRFAVVYLRNTAGSGAAPLNVSDISIAASTESAPHNFYLDSDFSTLTTVIQNTNSTNLVPGSTSGATSNPSFLTFGGGELGSGYIIESEDPAVARTEYIDGVDRIKAEGIPAASYRCFVIAEIPTQESLQTTLDDILTLTIDSSTVNINLATTAIHGINKLVPHIYQNGIDLNGNTVTDSNVLGTLSYANHLSDQQTTPQVFNWLNGSMAGLIPIDTANSNITTLTPEATLIGTYYHSVVVGWKSLVSTLGTAGNRVLGHASMYVTGIQGINDTNSSDQIATGSGSSASNGWAHNHAWLPGDAPTGSAAPAIGVQAPHEADSELGDVLTNELYLVEFSDQSTTSSSDGGIRYNISYSPSISGTPLYIESGIEYDLTQIFASIKVVHNKKYWMHATSTPTSNALSGSVTIPGYGTRGVAVALTNSGLNQSFGGVTVQTNGSSVATSLGGVTVNFPADYPSTINLTSAVGNGNLTTNVSGLEGLTANYFILSVTGTTDVADAGTSTLQMLSAVPLSSLTLGTSATNFNEYQGGTATAEYTWYPPEVDASGNLDYTKHYTKTHSIIKTVTNTGWTVQNQAPQEATPLNIKFTASVTTRPAELMLAVQNPVKNRFNGMVYTNEANPDHFIGYGLSSVMGTTYLNEGYVETATKGAPYDSWLTSLNGICIEAHSNRTHWDAQEHAVMMSTSLGLYQTNTFNEFGNKIDVNGLSSDSTSTTYPEVEYGVLAYKIDGETQGNSTGNVHYNLGTVTTANTSGNTPWAPETFNNFARNLTSGLFYASSLRTYDVATMTTQAANKYQNMQTFWLYNPGGEALRILGGSLTDFKVKTMGSGAGTWAALTDDTSGLSPSQKVDPNVIFADTGAGQSPAGGSAVSSPIKVWLANIADDAHPSMEDIVFYSSTKYTTYTASTQGTSGNILTPTNEFTTPITNQLLTNAVESSAMMYNNPAERKAFRAIPIHVWYDHVHITNADLSTTMTPLATATSVSALLSINFVTNTDIASQGASMDKTPTTIYGDLTDSDNSSLDDNLTVQTITVRVMMSFNQAVGSLTITDEDDNNVANGGTISFIKK